MKIMRIGLVLSACLLGSLLTRTGFNPHVTTPSSPAGSSLIPVAGTGVCSTPPRETSLPQTRIPQTNGYLVPMDAESPDNSLDLDQNRDWARKNPAGALAWLVNAPDGPQLEAVAEIVCSEMARTNPAQAVALVERCNLSNTNYVRSLLDNLVQQWAGQDMQAASAWALAKPAGEDQDRLLGRIAFVKSKNNPEEAARFVAEQMSPGAVQDEAVISVIYQWALRDANAAMAWAQLFPEGNLRYRAIQEVRNKLTVNCE